MFIAYRIHEKDREKELSRYENKELYIEECDFGIFKDHRLQCPQEEYFYVTHNHSRTTKNHQHPITACQQPQEDDCIKHASSQPRESNHQHPTDGDKEVTEYSPKKYDDVMHHHSDVSQECEHNIQSQANCHQHPREDCVLKKENYIDQPGAKDYQHPETGDNEINQEVYYNVPQSQAATRYQHLLTGALDCGYENTRQREMQYDSINPSQLKDAASKDHDLYTYVPTQTKARYHPGASGCTSHASTEYY